MSLSNRGQLALPAGDHAAAQAFHEQALTAADTVDTDYLRACLPGLATSALDQNRPEVSARLTARDLRSAGSR